MSDSSGDDESKKPTAKIEGKTTRENVPGTSKGKIASTEPVSLSEGPPNIFYGLKLVKFATQKPLTPIRPLKIQRNHHKNAQLWIHRKKDHRKNGFVHLYSNSSKFQSLHWVIQVQTILTLPNVYFGKFIILYFLFSIWKNSRKHPWLLAHHLQ